VSDPIHDQGEDIGRYRKHNDSDGSYMATDVTDLVSDVLRERSRGYTNLRIIGQRARLGRRKQCKRIGIRLED
jgi:hypothetical protein